MESDILQVRFTEEGKNYIRKFVSISYVLFSLVICLTVLEFYQEIKLMVEKHEAGLPVIDTYAVIYILWSILSVISNVYYVRFPIVLLRSIEGNDETEANKSFGLFFKSAVIFLITLIISTGLVVWNILNSSAS